MDVGQVLREIGKAMQANPNLHTSLNYKLLLHRVEKRRGRTDVWKVLYGEFVLGSATWPSSETNPGHPSENLHLIQETIHRDPFMPLNEKLSTISTGGAVAEGHVAPDQPFEFGSEVWLSAGMLENRFPWGCHLFRASGQGFDVTSLDYQIRRENRFSCL